MKVIINDENTMVARGVCALLDGKPLHIRCADGIDEVDREIQLQYDNILITELVSMKDDFKSIIEYLIKKTESNPHLKIIALTEISEAAILGLVRFELPSVLLLKKTESIVHIHMVLKDLVNGNGLEPFWGYTSTLNSEKHITIKELGLMKLIGQGLSHSNIGKRVSLSPKAVSYYRRSIYNKMKCSSEANFAYKMRMLGFSGCNDKVS
jgi:DNA-binding NarL/FixJ family response regulator